MIGTIILFFFAIVIVKAEGFELAPGLRNAANIVWEDDQPPVANYFLKHTNKVDTVTQKPASNDDVPLWSSKDSGLNLKFPRFLFTDDEEVSPRWTEKPKVKKLKLNVKSPNLINKDVITEFNKPLQQNEVFKMKNVDVNKADIKNVVHKTVFVQAKPNSEELLIKNKIFSLAKDAERDMGAKIKIIEKTNAMFKHNNYYKLGFIVSYINTTHNALADLMKYVERNKENWDVLKILNAYVQIKKTKEFLTELLSVLSFLQSRQSVVMPPLTIEKKGKTNNIAWSYYDDDQ